MEDPRVVRSRAAILDATVASVLERGIDGSSVEDICARSGVARTTVYRHWDTKPDLVLEALSQSLEPPTVPDTGAVREDLVALVGGFARALADGPLARLLAVMAEGATRDAQLAEVHHREARRRHAVVRDVIDRGVARGQLPTGLDVDHVVAAVLGPVVYRVLVAGHPVGSGEVAAIVDDALPATPRAAGS
ncbi:TetR/AcrR family transcriptional regulator [Salsipaludibacter albus]|uniref:TetR/AcrR family transcriptional regulator n=1 Tax=Salsipaludibacter albus TaxID=2849650 RepID=UPI001EE3C450|nr:TetR/AcrR family transcriptional regulator [Salsipaludibacter albus]